MSLLTLLITFFTLLTLFKTGAAFYRKIIYADTYNFPCDISNSNQQLYLASLLLTDDASTSVSTTALAGWLFLRGYLDQDYTIFSFHEAQLSQKLLVYSFSYSPNSFTVKETIGSSAPVVTQLVGFNTLQWFYIRSWIKKDSTTISGGTTIWNTRTPIFSSTLSAPLSSFTFIKAILLFNVGNSNTNLPSIVPSCSVSRYVCAFSEKPDDNEVVSFRNDIQAVGIQLMWHYDQFYTSTNPGKLMSFGKSEDALIIPTLDTNPLVFTAGHTLTTDFIKTNDNLGFTVQFSVKMTSTPPAGVRCRLLTIIDDIGFIDNYGGNQLTLGTSNVMSGVNFGEWIQVITIIKYGLQARMLLSAFNYHGQQKYIYIPNYKTLRLRFGSTTNTDTFIISSIRIYSGFYVSSAGNCEFTILTLPTLSCLACKTSYLIDFQNGYTCTTGTADSTYPFQKAWSPSRQTCTAGMIHDIPTTASATCRCRNQHYFNGSICAQCERYCDECSGSSSACITKDPNRSWSNECLPGYFDDGYNCKDRQQLIPDTVISEFYFANPTYVSSTLQPYSETFQDSFLSLVGKSSLLFTFSYQPTTITYANSVIATVILDSVEVFTLLIDSTSIGKLLSLKILNSIVWSYYIHPNNASWFALWSDLAVTSFQIHTNGMLYSQEFSITITTAIANPYICIGSCTSQYSSGTQSLGILNNRPFKFLTNTLNPYSLDEQVLNLMLLDAVVLANFSFSLQVYESSYLGEYQSTDVAGRIMNFYSTQSIVTSQLKGFGYYFENTQSIVDVGAQITFPISYASTIWIETINSQTSLLSYYYAGNLMVEYYLVPSEAQSHAVVRICFGYDCKDTELGKLYYQEANFLAIFTMELSPFSEEFLRIQFKVVCNYQSETLTYIIARPIQSQVESSTVNFAQQTEETKNYSLFLNRIYLINGNSYFYENLSATNHCYFSFGNNPSTCIYPKEGYALYGATILSNSDCNSQPFTIHFVNTYTKVCIDSQQPKSECISIDQNTLRCTECAFGYYLPPDSYFCEPCALPCTSCTGSSTYCLTCFSTTQQLAPTCECTESDYYMNSGFLCEQCDTRCETCSGSATNCSTCAANRSPPPTCPCNNLYAENSTTQECMPICQSQCTACSNTPSNCQSCKPNRTEPPLCECLPNYYEIFDGSCEMCISGTYYSYVHLQCLPCQLPCTECLGSASFCLACESDLFLKNNKCYCGSEDNSSYVVKPNGTLVCSKSMDITEFTFSMNSNLVYVLEFTFEKQLYSNSISSYQAPALISIYLNGVSADWYYLSNPRMNAYTFSVDLIAYKAFQATTGYVLFLQTSPFMSNTYEEVLNRKYLSTPLKIQQIGPLLFTSTEAFLPQISLKDSSTEFYVAIQGLQVVFYFLNSLQPTVIVLLLKLQLPPNLYSFLQMVGVYVFPDVQNQGDSTPANNFEFYDIDLEFIQFESSDEFMFKRLGLLKSLFATIPLICLKYFMLLTSMLAAQMWVASSYNRDLSLKVESFLQKQLIDENEVNLLLSWISIYIQMSNTDEDSWVSRYGFYCSLMIIVTHGYSLYQIWKGMYCRPVFIRKKQQKQDELQNNPYYNHVNQRIKKKRWFRSKTYFIFQMAKKYLIIAVVYVFREFQTTVCILCSFVFLASAVSTIQMRPYEKNRSRYVKIIVDVSFFFVWLILIRIVSAEFELYSTQPFNEDVVNLYNTLGYVVVVLLILANVVYAFEQLFCLVESILEYVRNKKQRIKENSQHQSSIQTN